MALDSRNSVRWSQRIGMWTVGFFFNWVADWVFDYVIYGAVLAWTTYKWGLGTGGLMGFLIMAPISALISWLHFPVYDYLKKDWFGLETLKELREAEEDQSRTIRGRLRRLTTRILRMGTVPALVFLSIQQGPFIATAYLRKGAHQYNGLSTRDWWIFWTSTVIGNLYWAFALGTAATLFRLALEWLRAHF